MTEHWLYIIPYLTFTSSRQPHQVWWKYVKLSILDGLKMHWELAIAAVLNPVCQLAKLQCEAQVSSSHHPVNHTQEVFSLLSKKQVLKHRQNWIASWEMRGSYKYRFPHLPPYRTDGYGRSINTYGSVQSEANDIVFMYYQVKMNLPPASVCTVS